MKKHYWDRKEEQVHRLCEFRNYGTDQQLRIRELFAIGNNNFGG
jgi:hypothetical protein